MVFEATTGDTNYDNNPLDDEEDEDMNYVRNTLSGLGLFSKDFVNSLNKNELDSLYAAHCLR
jgi:hypothetical protein